MRLKLPLISPIAAAVMLAAFPVQAEKLTVSQYGRIIATLPWAVALNKGMFKEAGLDIDDITAGSGGGTSLRNMLAGDLPFAEIATPAVIAGVRAGIALKIVMGSSNHIGELAWAALPSSGVTSIKDLVGKRVAFTNPKSTTEMVIRSALEREGLAGKVDSLPIGGLGPALTALAQGAVAAAPLTDPALTLQPEKYKVLFYAHEYYPKFTWAVGVTTPDFAAKHPQKLHALLRAHRKAVEFIYADREGAAQVYAQVWEVDLAQARALLPKYYDWVHWSRGDFSKEGLDAVVQGLNAVGELNGPFDWSKVIDQSFLDEDLRRPL
ncbi:MAG: ABC transporter substrate-binding protein [Proteobacteria bacterium]|nr:ABC transporter substrate-binding protein [Pseudomonadota bacterium]